jgi:hypothetical protein
MSMNDALTYRLNPWLVAALVTAIVLLAPALILVASESGLIHLIGGMLQSPQQMAPLCGSSSGPCP